ncbi:MAG: signal peptidase I [Firmicutes bacterium]|jgi:signal peptidase I|nr:signal peptidase I [Bacillota bacterium]MDH7495995.1 signal peptidase I [Bacillota bacterium]
MRGVRLWLTRFVLHPDVFFHDVKAGSPVWPSLSIAALAHWGTGVYLSEALAPDVSWLPAYIASGLVVGAAIAVALLAVLHVVARVLGGRGDIRDLARVWGYTHLPEMVTGVILAAILKVTVFSGLAQRSPGVGWLIGIVVVALITALWSIILRIQAVKVVYDRGVLTCTIVLILFGIASGVLGGAAQFAVQTVGVRAPIMAALMDPMDPRLARDVRAISEGQMSLAVRLGSDDGTMNVPINARAHPPRRGDMVVFCRDDHTRSDLKHSARLISMGIGFGRGASDFVADVGIARVVGLGGDTVEVRSGRVVLNGKELDEPYVKVAGDISVKPVNVPEGSFFLLGDNRLLEPESYGAGIVAGERILGRTLRTWMEISVPVLRALLFG